MSGKTHKFKVGDKVYVYQMDWQYKDLPFLERIVTECIIDKFGNLAYILDKPVEWQENYFLGSDLRGGYGKSYHPINENFLHELREMVELQHFVEKPLTIDMVNLEE
jgi:hypothetical protein